MPDEIESLISECKLLFGKIPRPEIFTSDPGSDEGAEHEATLRLHTPDSISLNELGNPGWDPIFFISPQAYKYYFPALTRLTVEDMASGDFLDRFLFHLRFNGEQNRFLRSFSELERNFVVRFLKALNRKYSEIIEVQYNPFEFEATLKLWDPNR